MKAVWPRPSSLCNWRMASKKAGLDVADRAADLHQQEIQPVGDRHTNSLIMSVTCGITCTVRPRYAAPLLLDHLAVDAARR